MRRAHRLLAALAALALAGCTALPDSGPVYTSNPRLPERSEVDVLYSGPTNNAEPREIIEGFLAASAAGYSDEFAAAKLYLTETAALSWDPYAGVDVIDSAEPIPPEEVESGGVRVTSMSVAEVDSRGRYTVRRQPVEVVRTFSLIKNAAGQWRIATLPNGIAIPDVRFEQIFDRVPLYFITPDTEVLVPEARWFPRPHLVSGALAALLSGPSSWLQPGVRTAVPDGTRINGNIATTNDAVTVDLTVPGERPDANQLQLIYTQIQRTLAGSGTVQSVQLRINGTQVIPVAAAPVIEAPNTASQPLAISAGKLVRWNGRDLVPVPNPAGVEGPLASPSAPFDGSAGPIVVLDATGSIRTIPAGQGPSEVLIEGPDLIPPSVDRLGWVWSGPRQARGSLTVTQHAGQSQQVDVPWLDGPEVMRARISADGARALILMRVGATVVVRVAAVIRDENGTPTGLASPEDIVLPTGSVLDADWVGGTDVAILVRDQLASDPAVTIATLGGPRTTLPSVPGATQIASGNSDRSIVVATQIGDLYVRAGAGWRLAASGVTDPNYAG